MPFLDWSETEGKVVLYGLRDEPGPVLLALQAMMERFGYVHKEAVGVIANYFNVSRADVHGVLTFYHDLRTDPAPKNQVHICVAEACQAVGARELVASAEKYFGIKSDETHLDIEIKSTFCFGNCALGPAVMVNGKLIGRCDLPKINEAMA